MPLDLKAGRLPSCNGILNLERCFKQFSVRENRAAQAVSGCYLLLFTAIYKLLYGSSIIIASRWN